MSIQALAGIKVIDFSRFLPAPFCSMTLGDFGADVIRIEQPNEVEKQERTFGRDKLPLSEKRRLKSQEMLARNKRSVMLDLRSEAGRKAARALVQSADVLLHDYRPGVMEKMGLGYSDLIKVHPKLIYCAVSLCGQDGPYSNLPGHDPIALALSGALWRFGDGEIPHIPGLPVGDLSTGLQATIGILLALRARDQNGEGQLVDIAMSDSSLGLMTSVMQRFLMDQHEPDLSWRRTNVGTWQCADGKYLCTTDLEPAYWQKFCTAVERPDLFSLDSTGSKNPDGDYQRLQRELEQLFLSKPRDYWFELLSKAGTQVAPVNTLNEALVDQHATARKLVTREKDDQGNEVTQIGPVIKLSSSPGSVKSLGHMPGVDTEQVLKEIGYSAEDIDKITLLSE